MPFIKHTPPPPPPCNHIEHNPPMHILLPAGTHEYQCPACGKIQVLNVPEVSCKVKEDRHRMGYMKKEMLGLM